MQFRRSIQAPSLSLLFQSLLAITLSITNCVATSAVESESRTSSKKTSEPSVNARAETPYNVPYPKAASIKGLQVEIPADAIALGIDHAALNLNLCQLVRPDGGKSTISTEIDGKAFHFNTNYLQSLDRQVRQLSEQGVLVNVILLTYLSNDPQINDIMIHPDCIDAPPNRLGAFNTRSEEGRRWLSATIEFLAERWSRPDEEHGRVVGWIVGNEVNSHWWWSNQGLTSMEDFASDYEQAVRLIHTAVRTASLTDRVYISLEHHWTIRFAAASEMQGFAAKPFLEHFAKLVKQNGDIDWHLAFHPYPEDLFDPAFWLDTSATESDDTKRVTPKNLEVLVRLMNQSEMKHAGESRRIILSEQGFHSKPTKEGELLQAAAYCYAYRLILQFPEIDAFILHRHVDHRKEGGLNLGLRRVTDESGPLDTTRPRKPIYRCFQFADTEQWQDAFRFALPIVGLDSWPATATP